MCRDTAAQVKVAAEEKQQQLEDEVLLSRRDRAQVWCRTYFWEGQTLRKDEQEKQVDPNASFLTRHRKLVAFALPGVIVQSIWWAVMAKNDWFYLFTEHSSGGAEYFWMTITMVFGSMVAGMTSEGGAAVAFPVMTLAMDIAPSVARDFSFMIQSAGMTAAACTIYLMRVQVEFRALLHGSLGGIAGIILGLEQVAPRLSPPYKKMYFVCIWAAFAFSLYWLNRYHDRKTYSKITRWRDGEMTRYLGGTLGPWVNWKAALLMAFGFLGGIFSAISGSGIDICTFAVLTLFFRVSEKIATPTSVMLMAVNTVVGFAYREFVQGGVESEAWSFFAVCVPVVVIGAPLGSLLGSHFHRLVLASLVYVLDTVQLVGALVIVEPWTTKKTDTPLHLSLSSLAIILSGGVFFRLLASAGSRYMCQVEARNLGGDDPVKGVELKGPACDRSHSTAQSMESASIGPDADSLC